MENHGKKLLPYNAQTKFWNLTFQRFFELTSKTGQILLTQLNFPDLIYLNWDEQKLRFGVVSSKTEIGTAEFGKGNHVEVIEIEKKFYLKLFSKSLVIFEIPKIDRTQLIQHLQNVKKHHIF